MDNTYAYTAFTSLMNIYNMIIRTPIQRLRRLWIFIKAS